MTEYVPDAFVPMKLRDALPAAVPTAPSLDRLRDHLPEAIDLGDWEGHEAPEREWMWQDWLAVRSAALLAGRGSAGKSLFGQQLATATVLGRPFLGAATTAAPAIYLTCEDEGEELWRRQAAICASMGTDLAELKRRGLYLVSWKGRQNNELGTFGDDDTFKLSAAYRNICSAAQTVRARLIILDNVAHLFTGNENVRNQVAAFCSAMDSLAMRIDGSVLFLGHPAKREGEEYSGSTGWDAHVRQRLFMERQEGDGADLDARTIRRSKANYSQRGAEIAFRWHLGAFIREDELPEDRRSEIAANVQASTDNHLFLGCLRERIKQERAVSENPASRTYAPLVFAAMPESKGIGRARLEAALDRLFRVGAIERGFLWRSDRKDRHGLRERCADLRADPALTGCADVRRHGAPTAPTLTPSTTYYPGAAHEAAAPFDGEEARQ